jgi:hypothetical protein
MAESRYTLSLPTEIYNELREIAEHRGLSVKDVVRQCLKIGLVAIKLDEDPEKELIVKEKLPGVEGNNGFREVRLQFIW